MAREVMLLMFEGCMKFQPRVAYGCKPSFSVAFTAMSYRVFAQIVTRCGVPSFSGSI
jgi:hypothetical protein